MKETTALAKRLREVIIDGRWVAGTNLKEQITDLTYDKALIQVNDLNSIAALTFHINYYISGVSDFFETGKLKIRDQFSFDLPSLNSEDDWTRLKNELISNTEKLASQIENLSDSDLDKVFVNEKYGDYRRNIEGIIEHCYYHFGQIRLIKKLLNKRELYDEKLKNI